MLFEPLASPPRPAYNDTVPPIAPITADSQTATGGALRAARLCSRRAAATACEILLAVALGLSGCARHATPTAETAFRLAEAPILSDDLALEELASALESQRAALNRKPAAAMRFGPRTISQGEYASALELLAAELRSPARSTAEKLRYISDSFDFMEIYGGEEWGTVLLTGYFEPVIEGSLKRTSRFTQPLYAKPSDLLTVRLAPFASRLKGEPQLKGRIEQDQVVPYYSRREIDGGHALRGRKLELCWTDPVDAFFLQIQGSGTVMLTGGSSLHLTYADKNGHAYVPIGKFLKERLSPQPVTMQSIVKSLRQMAPHERDALLFENPSYVFFRRSAQRAVTSSGIPATPGRTIAADPAFAPKGALAFISFAKPVFPPGSDVEREPVSHTEVSRFVLDQDSGGAITGTGRVDLFWGRGDEAKMFAGRLQEPARVWYLVPKAR